MGLPAGDKASMTGLLRTTRERVPALAPCLIGLAALAMVWSRMMVLQQGMWGDEVISVLHYVNRGPSGIWDPHTWIPNDHMLFELLTWATTGILGTGIEATYRLWGVLPAIAAAGLMTWWLWQRLDRWAAAIFAVLSTVSPLFFDLGTQARGYGLGFLSGVIMVVAADRLQRTRSNAALLAFAAGGLLGILTLIDCAAGFVAVSAILMFDGALRRRVAITVAVVAALTLLWYIPVLTPLLNHSEGVGSFLPWYSFATGPVHDFLGEGISAVAPGISVTAASVIAGLTVAAAAGSLTWARERFLLAFLLVPPLLVYLGFQFAHKLFEPRFASFTMLPLLALAAIGLAAAGRGVARIRTAGPGLAVALAVAGSLAGLDEFVVNVAAPYAQVPREASAEAGQIERGFRGPVLIGPQIGIGSFVYYRFPARLISQPPDGLERTLCTSAGPLMYIEDSRAPRENTACLTARDAFRIFLPSRLSHTWLWLVPRRRGTAAGAAIGYPSAASTQPVSSRAR